MDILNATRPAARVAHLQSHLRDLWRITAASWGLAPSAAGPFLPCTSPLPARAAATARTPPPALRA
jgi:hypothetical protein